MSMTAERGATCWRWLVALSGLLLFGCASSVVTEGGSETVLVAEAWQSASYAEDNVDSPASWLGPQGQHWVLLTAKHSHVLLLFDGDSGQLLRRVGGLGRGAGDFNRPNGIFVIDNLVLVAERDNHRIQVLRLPELISLGSFGQTELRAPYGLWVRREGDGYEVFVSDSYMDGEQFDVVPPLATLDRRFARFGLQLEGNGLSVESRGHFGATDAAGAIRITESLWGDPAHDRLLLAEEDASDGTRVKLYDLQGRYRGQDLGRGLLRSQAEGIALWACADGSGYWILTDQGPTRSDFHVFDRQQLTHQGSFASPRTANTDGIWLQQTGTERFPAGVFYAVHDDQALSAFDWRDVAAALGLRQACE